MKYQQMFAEELRHEAATLRKFLQRVPDDKFDWQPHPKSMTMEHLCNHLVDIAGWPAFMLNTQELDFSKPYENPSCKNAQQLVQKMDENASDSVNRLTQATDEEFGQHWVMRMGEQVIADLPKSLFIRHALSQLIHHRAQLGLYLRLLEVPIPGSYGPSADEQGMSL